eukprot:scaffold100460_cov57-Phaeocystis_antarctica.AAC.1
MASRRGHSSCTVNVSTVANCGYPWLTRRAARRGPRCVAPPCSANYHPRRASPHRCPQVRTCAPTLWAEARRHRYCCFGRRYTTI